MYFYFLRLGHCSEVANMLDCDIVIIIGVVVVIDLSRWQPEAFPFNSYYTEV